MRSFRGSRYFLAPPWLTGKGDGEKVAFTLEWLLDAWLERLRQGLNARFPTRAGESALGLIIGDRGLLRGRSETAAAVATRLKAWRSPRTHRVRGNAYEALLQIWHYWGGIYAAFLDSHGLRHEIAATDTPDVDSLADPENAPGWCEGFPLFTEWDGVEADAHWSRFWLVLQPPAALGIGPTPDLGDPDLWGGTIGTPGYLLGHVGVTAEDVSAMRALFQDLAWNPEHTQPEWVLLCLDPYLSSPYPIPDGNWQYWSKDDSGTRVAARTTPALSLTAGTMGTGEGAGTVNVPYPADIEAGELLFFHEGRSSASTSTPGASWTLVANQTGSFAHGALYAKIADGTESGNLAWSVSGGGNHVGVITRVARKGWSATVLDNFSEVVSTSSTNSAAPDPTNAAGQHRLHFVGADFFDVSITASSSGYTEIYDRQGNFNLSLQNSLDAESGSSTSFSEASLTWISISLVLNYVPHPWRFWSLDPAYNNTYTGLRSRPWPDGAELVDGSVYNGDRSNAAVWGPITLPNGETYAGSRTRFPERVLLLDDGSVVK